MKSLYVYDKNNTYLGEVLEVDRQITSYIDSKGVYCHYQTSSLIFSRTKNASDKNEILKELIECAVENRIPSSELVNKALREVQNI